MIFWRNIVIFHTKYPKTFASPSARRNFFKCALSNPGSATEKDIQENIWPKKAAITAEINNSLNSSYIVFGIDYKCALNVLFSDF
jgi:hypothetical protein